MRLYLDPKLELPLFFSLRSGAENVGHVFCELIPGEALFGQGVSALIIYRVVLAVWAAIGWHHIGCQCSGDV
jgi:hypothetical protein